MTKPELLAPAGNLEKLKWAVNYGADAVYFGMEFGSLRDFGDNFGIEDARRGLQYLHDREKKGYVTLNIYPFSEEYEKITKIAKELDSMGVDGFIVSDLGVISELGRLGLNAGIHVSTQANTVSYHAVLAYKELGAKRVNFARELSLEQISAIQSKVRGKIETEVFVHGSVCFSYSGRCAISDYLTGFRANRGQCKHPCRWKYSVVEEKRPGEYYPVAEDARGTYIFNCKELALFEYVEELIRLGVDSFKIEGRNKSVHYIATVVSFYRQVIDGVKFSREAGLGLLNRVPNRGYSQGFMKGSIEPEDYKFLSNDSKARAIFVGNVTEEKVGGRSILEVRNNISAGQEVEVLTPDGNVGQVKLPSPLVTTKGEKLESANNSHCIVLDREFPTYTVFRVLYPE